MQHGMMKKKDKNSPQAAAGQMTKNVPQARFF